MKKIILASSSPRREELLKKLGLKFDIVPSDYKEEMGLNLKPHNLVKYLSRKKAKDVAKKYKDAIVIGADTLCFLDREIFPKPKTLDDAKRMLKESSARSQSVISAFTIIDTKTKKLLSKAVETKVYFKKITLKEIDSYLKKEEFLDKAGAYAIQGLGSILIKKIEGDYFNVVGLPISSLVDELKKFGIRILN